MISSLEVPASSNISIQEPENQPSNQDQAPASSNTATNNQGLQYPMELVRTVVAEAVGCFIMVFCISGILASRELLGIQVGLMAYATTAALTVILLVTSLGSISGAHVNPAVTIAFAVLSPFPWAKVPFYVLAQIVGCVSATYAGSSIYGIKSEVLMTKPISGSIAAFMVEFIATTIIVFVIAASLDDPQSNGQFTAFLVGMAIGLGVLITGSVSGGSMNPARSLGPALVSRDFDQIWIYLLAPTFGSISGGLLYRLLRLQGWSDKPSSQMNQSLANEQ